MARIYLTPAGGEPVEVDVERTGDRVRFTLGGDAVEARLVGERLLLDGRVVPFAAVRGDAGLVDVWVEGRTWRFGVSRRRSHAPGAAVAAASGEVAAPMPGTIIGISVAVGEEVAAGGRVAVLESMKMEVDLAAPRSGRVEEIRCAVGDLVEIGTVVAVVGDGG